MILRNFAPLNLRRGMSCKFEYYFLRLKASCSSIGLREVLLYPHPIPSNLSLHFHLEQLYRISGIYDQGFYTIINNRTIHMYNRIAGYKQYYKSLVMLGVPIIIGQLGAIITGLADTIMVGQHSTEELAAASFVNNVINAFIIMGTGFSYNLTPLIGQNLAMNKKIVIGGWLKTVWLPI